MKQTAVEWLINRIEDGSYDINQWKSIKEEAKEMEYRQNMDAMQRGMELQEQENNRVGFRERNGLLSSQTEISDDEIEKEARKLANIEHNRPLDTEERYYKDYQKYDGIVIGMKWYREQLKKQVTNKTK